MLKHSLKKFCKDQQGFTLVEIIVTLAILSIVLVTAGTTYFYGVRMYTQTEVKNTEKSVGDSVYKYMQEKITYATVLDVRPERTKNTSNPKYMCNSSNSEEMGYLMFGEINGGEENVLGEKFYGSYKICYEVTVPQATKEPDVTVKVENLIQLKVIVRNSDDEEVYTTQGTIKNLNCNVTVNGKSSEEKVVSENPLISYKLGAETEVDPAMALAMQLRTDYINLYECIYDAGIAYKGNADKIVEAVEKQYHGYKEMGGTWFPSNSKIIEYLVKYTYKGTWPEYPQPSERLLGKYPAIKNFYYPSSGTVTKLYMKPFCGDLSSRDSAEKNCFVFVSESKDTFTSWYGTYYIIDCLEAKTYASSYTKNYNGQIRMNHNGTGFATSKPWEYTKNTDLADESKWQLFE